MSKYRQGDKFVIEISDVMGSERGTLYRADFSTLVFDDYGLDNLPQLVDGVNEACYNKGLADAWEAARKIHSVTAGGGLPVDVVQDLFGNGNPHVNYTAQEAITKIKEWEDSKEIKRGDEVNAGGYVNGIVTRVYGHETKCAYIQWPDGSNGRRELTVLTKTGRNFADKLDALLSEIGGDNDE